MRPKPSALIILDGWGVAQPNLGNATTNAKTPNFDEYVQKLVCIATCYAQ